MMPGGAASGRKGATYERRLVNSLRSMGYGAMRLPASGSSTKEDLPDIMAGRPMKDWDHHTGRPTSFLWAIEHKSGSQTTLYVSGDEVAALERFSEIWGARPLLGARFTSQASPTAHYLVKPEDARGPTDGGNYGLPLADIEDRAFKIISEPDDL